MTKNTHGELCDLLDKFEDGTKNLLILMPRGTYKCVSPDSRINLPNGSLAEAKNLSVGDEVLSYSQEKGFIPSKIVAVKRNKLQDMRTIKFRSGRTIQVSHNHPLLTVKGFVKSEELSVGSRIMAWAGREIEGSITGRSDEAWLLGLMVGDGCCTCGRVTIGDHKTLAKATEVCKQLGFDLKKRSGKYEYTFKGITGYLRKWGLLGKTSWTKELPNIYDYSSEFRKSFIAGYFSADGSYEKCGKANFTTVSKSLAFGISDLMRTVGIFSDIKYYKYPDSSYYRVNITDPISLKALIALPIVGKKNIGFTNQDGMYRTVPKEWRELSIPYRSRKRGFRIDNKYHTSFTKFRKFAQEIKMEWASTDEVVWDEIVSIDTYYGESIDFQIENTSTFLIEGIVTHNTTIVLFAYMVRELLKDKTKTYALQFASFEKGTNWMMEIQQNFEKPEVVALYGESQNSSCWRKDKLILKGAPKSREGSVMIFGADQGMAGYHPKRVIFDDLHDDKNSTTSDQVAKIVKVFSRTVTEIATKDTKCIMVATIWDKADSAAKIVTDIECIEDWDDILKKRHHKGIYWDIYIRQAVEDDPDGVPISIHSPKVVYKKWEKAKFFFPEELGWDILNQKYTQSPSDYDFTCQFFNSPKMIENLFFTKEMTESAKQLADEHPTPEIYGGKYLLVDPAYSVSKRSDHTGFIVCGFDREKRLHILLSHKIKADAKEVVDTIFSLQQQWKPRVVAIEANSAQRILPSWMKEKQRQSGIFFRITEIKTGPIKSKIDRIKRLVPYFKEGRIAIPAEFEDLHEELAGFPRSNVDDLIDALAFIEDVRKPFIFRKKKIEDKYKPLCERTGI